MSSFSQNQDESPEPIPASATEAEATTPGSGHPQAPSGTTGAGAGDVGDAASVPTSSSDAAPGTSEQTPVAQGVRRPDVEEPDTRS